MRKTYLDNIKWMIQIIVVIVHVLFMYNAEGIYGGYGKITNLDVQYYDMFIYIVFPWAMPILFLIAGMNARYYLDSHSISSYVKKRTIKLLIPSTISLFCFWFIQGYMIMYILGINEAVKEASSLWKYFVMVINGIGVLWFIQVLWIYSMLLIPIKLLDKDRLWNLGKKVNPPVLMSLVVVIWGAGHIFNSDFLRFYRLGFYFAYFFIGYFIFSHDEILNTIKNKSLLFTIIALVSSVIFCIKYWNTDLTLSEVNTSFIFMMNSWFACLSILGLMQKYGNFKNKFTAFMSKRCYGLYIFHNTFICLLAIFIGIPRKAPALIVYILSLICGFGGGFLMDAIVSKIPFVRFILLGKTTNTSHLSGSR